MWRSYAGFRGWLWGHLIFWWARLGFLMLLWWVYLLEQRVWFYGPSNYIGLEAQTEGTTSCLTTLGCRHFLDLFCAYLSTLWPVHIFKQFIVLDTSHTYLTWRAESGDFMLQDKMPTCRLNTLLIDTQLFAVKLPKKTQNYLPSKSNQLNYISVFSFGHVIHLAQASWRETCWAASM